MRVRARKRARPLLAGEKIWAIGKARDALGTRALRALSRVWIILRHPRRCVVAPGIHSTEIYEKEGVKQAAIFGKRKEEGTGGCKLFNEIRT